MRQISQPHHKNAAAGEKGYWTLLEGSYMIDFIVVLLDLENSDIVAVSFEGTKSKYSWTPST